MVTYLVYLPPVFVILGSYSADGGQEMSLFSSEIWELVRIKHDWISDREERMVSVLISTTTSVSHMDEGKTEQCTFAVALE